MTTEKYHGFIGTYTKGESKGIYSFVFDTKNEQIVDIKCAAKVNNPTYVTISKDNQYLYSVAQEDGLGGVAVFAIDPDTIELKELNRLLTEGSAPCYVGINDERSQVVSAYYHRGLVEAFEVNTDGSLKQVSATAQHHGSGPNPDRQEKPHTHYSNFTPNEKFIAVVDLGIDELITYDVTDGKLTEVHKLKLRPGSGPRHITFHPNGKYAYIMTELSNEVVALEFNGEDGSFKELQYIPTIPADFTENSQGGAIRITSDGKFVYASNRGHNSIAIFKVNEENGELSFVDYASSEGNWPRDFNFDPTENYIIGSNQESGNLVLYRRDQESGKLTVLQKDIKVPYAVNVEFLHY